MSIAQFVDARRVDIKGYDRSTFAGESRGDRQTDISKANDRNLPAV
jgi:hypothetical protein